MSSASVIVYIIGGNPGVKVEPHTLEPVDVKNNPSGSGIAADNSSLHSGLPYADICRILYSSVIDAF